MKKTSPKCPSCGYPINPASMMGKLSAKKNPKTSEEMRDKALSRWNKKEKKDESK